MADTRTTVAPGLRDAIERSGYYPAVVIDAVWATLAGEPVEAYLVHQEATFDRDELRRHVTVLVLTPTRLIAGHTDEHPPDDTSSVPYATTSTETVPIDRITSVAVTRVVGDPARYVPGQPLREVVITAGWGAVNRLDLEPATCSDPTCEADHGYTGTSAPDDLAVRVSEAADGAGVVAQAVVFADALTRATVRTRR